MVAVLRDSLRPLQGAAGTAASKRNGPLRLKVDGLRAARPTLHAAVCTDRTRLPAWLQPASCRPADAPAQHASPLQTREPCRARTGVRLHASGLQGCRLLPDLQLPSVPAGSLLCGV